MQSGSLEEPKTMKIAVDGKLSNIAPYWEGSKKVTWRDETSNL